jgi:sensor c-di-GMP phosphodiesterase-like protein
VLAVLALLAGTAVGVSVGRHEAVHQMRSHLEQFAARTLAEADASSLEARQVLAEMNGSQLPVCSEPDIDNLRRLVFGSEYLKDAGRLQGSNSICSAMSWRTAEPAPMPPPSFTSPDGTSGYLNLIPPDGGGKSAFALSLGGAYVVFSPYIEAHRAIPPIRYFSSEIHHPSEKNRALPRPGLSRSAMTSNSSGVQGEILYGTRCSTHFYNCVTGWMTVSEAVALNRRLIATYAALGGLCGLLLAILAIYLRARGWEMQRQLARAIRRGEIELLYQPIVDLQTRRIVGAEALARWQDREGNPVSPEVFIPLAVRHGLIGELTRLVLWRGLHDQGPLLRRPEPFQLSLNVTAEDLTGRAFVEMLQAATFAASVEPGRIAIEITESSAARGPAAEATIQDLQAAGYSVHIDDFGTGYSSLSYLQDLAVNAIKIDRGFTRSLGTGAANLAVLPRVLAMAEALHLEVVVEGIETEDQAAYFVSTGQSLQGQGWLFGHPMTAIEIAERLREQNQSADASARSAVGVGG